MLKKKILISSGMVLALMGISISSFATTGVINTDTVKMRAESNLESKIVTLVSINDKVEVLEKSGDWYKAKFEDKTGYIYSQYVTVKEAVNEEEPVTGQTQETTSNNVTEQQAQGTTNINNQENSKEKILAVPTEKQILVDSKVKILPLINSNEIYSISKDTKVTVIEYINGWCYIVSENSEGWIRIEKLTDVVQKSEESKVEENKETNESSNTTEETKKETTSKAYVNVEMVNVRKTASTSSEIVTNLGINAEVTIISEENNWCKIKTGKTQGYIAKKYLSNQKTEAKVTNRSLDIDRTSNDLQANEAQIETSANGENIVSYAKKFLGVKYVHGGSTPSGFDCSGFTSYVYKNFGYTLSRTSKGQANDGNAVNKSEMQVGDIVIFNNSANSSIGHVGIYIGNNQFIHASSPGDVVKITSLSMNYYKARFVAARRIL